MRLHETAAAIMRARVEEHAPWKVISASIGLALTVAIFGAALMMPPPVEGQPCTTTYSPVTGRYVHQCIFYRAEGCR